jgi:tetratricopeptide (TPR) repeat protein
MGHPRAAIPWLYNLAMSFRDLVNGETSDLVLPHDVSPNAQTVGGVAGAAVLTVATIAAAHFLPGGIPGSAVGRGVGGAYGQLKAGSQRREEALATNEQNKILRLELGLRFLDRAQRLGGASADLLYRKSRALYSLRRFNAALSACLEATVIDPGYLRAHSWCGFLYMALAKFSPAIEVLEKAHRINARDLETLQYLAEAYEKSGDLERSNQYWQDASSIEPNHLKPWLKQASYHAEKGQYSNAREAYTKAHRIDASTELPWMTEMGAADTEFAAGRFKEADQIYVDVLKWNSSYCPAVLGRAKCAFAVGNLQEAVLLSAAAANADPTNADAFMLAGEVNRRLGEMDKANAQWLKAFQLNENLPVPWVLQMGKAKAAFDLGDTKVAIGHLEEAKRLNPSWPEVDRRLREVTEYVNSKFFAQDGNVKAQAGQFSEAESSWKQSLKLRETSDVHMALGAEYADRGITSNALFHFERAMSLGHPLAQKALSLCRAYHDFSPEIGPS